MSRFFREEIKHAVKSGNLTINQAYVITMGKQKIRNCRDKDELRAAMAAELKKTLSKAFRDCIAELKKKYPGILLTKEEAAELMKELSITLKTELDKLTQKGKK